LVGLSTDELIKIRNDIDQLIKNKIDKDLNKRQGQKTKVKIPKNLETGKDFFGVIAFHETGYPNKLKISHDETIFQ